MAKIQSLHGTTVAEIFQSGMDNLAQIDAVALTVLWKDGSMTAGWSNVPAPQLALMVLALDQKQRRDNLGDL